MSTEAVESESVELTEREIALAQGLDPDTVGSEASTENRDGAGEVTDDAASSTPADQDESTAESVGQPVKDDGAIGTPDGGTEAAEPAVPAWIKDEHRELAKSYGITADDLQDFGSEQEFRRVGRMIDKQFAAQAAPVETPAPQQAVQPKAPATDNVSVTRPDLDPDKFKAAGYDDEVLNVVKFAKEREAEFAKLQERLESQERANQEAEYRRTYETLEATYDSMDGRRYGRRANKDGSQRELSRGERESRDRVNQAANTLAAGIIHTGKQLPPIGILLQRAEALTFAEDIRAEERRKVQAAITDQSKRRRPVAGQRPVKAAARSGKPTTMNEYAAEVANSPAVVKAWNDAQEAAGAA
jgi:hypothetical protein